MYRPPAQRKRRDWDALADSTRASNDTASSIIAYLLAGPALYGGLGYLADRWLDTGFLVAVGAVVGMALSLYVVWLRYGRT